MITSGQWVLVHESGRPAQKGEEVTSFRGEKMIITGGRPPHHSGSTGRIWVKENNSDREYYPSVCDLRWEVR
jgi:hypothetical protein